MMDNMCGPSISRWGASNCARVRHGCTHRGGDEIPFQKMQYPGQFKLQMNVIGAPRRNVRGFRVS